MTHYIHTFRNPDSSVRNDEFYAVTFSEGRRLDESTNRRFRMTDNIVHDLTQRPLNGGYRCAIDS